MRISSAAGLGFLTIAAALNGWASAATEETSCDQISKFAQERLNVSAKNSRKLETLQFPCELPAGPLSFQLLIATAPNPIETHLTLWFDREVESIQNAADNSSEIRMRDGLSLLRPHMQPVLSHAAAKPIGKRAPGCDARLARTLDRSLGVAQPLE
jgi:hypothetical protein